MSQVAASETLPRPRGLERDAIVDDVHGERELRGAQRDELPGAEVTLRPAAGGSLHDRDALRAV